jgi:hypothetical protein
MRFVEIIDFTYEIWLRRWLVLAILAGALALGAVNHIARFPPDGPVIWRSAFTIETRSYPFDEPADVIVARFQRHTRGTVVQQSATHGYVELVYPPGEGRRVIEALDAANASFAEALAADVANAERGLALAKETVGASPWLDDQTVRILFWRALGGESPIVLTIPFAQPRPAKPSILPALALALVLGSIVAVLAVAVLNALRARKIGVPREC